MNPWNDGKSWMKEVAMSLDEKQIAFIQGLMKESYETGKRDGLASTALMCEKVAKESRIKALQEMDYARDSFNEDVQKLRYEYLFNRLNNAKV